MAAFLILLGLLAGTASATTLEPQTISAFDAYVKKREAAMQNRGKSAGFLWSAEKAERQQALKSAGVVVEATNGKAVIDVDGGLIHDWSGATFIPGATLAQVVALLQDYENHKKIFQPEVIDSKLKSRDGNRFKTYLQLKKKKILTVVLNTEYDVTFDQLSPTRATSTSYSTRIAEIDDFGTEKQKEKPVGDDNGFLWRLNSYWRLEEKDGGVYVECEAISLSRGVPMLLSKIVTPIIKELPEQSLRNTLLAARRALSRS